MEKTERTRIGIGGLGPLEADIFRLISDKEKVTVREVYETLREERKIAYTTVMTIMSNLAKKGLLEQSKDTVAYIYTPVQKNTEVAISIVDKVIDKLLSGDRKPLLVHLLNLKNQEDLEKILNYRKQP